MMILVKIKNDLNQALRTRDEIRISTLRFLLAEIHNREIEKQTDLTEEDFLAVVRQQVKQHQESIVAYRRGNRDDLVRKEEAELNILSKYLPQEMSALELEKIVKQAGNGEIKRPS